MGDNLKKVDIKTGFLCNNNCLFCVQADNKCKGNRSFEDIKADLIESKKRCDSVVLTGGEITIRKDFFDIVKLAKDLGYNTIQIQSNGRMFASLDFCKKTIDAGATEFGLAIHGYCAEQHDFLTRSPGSFKQTYHGIKNLISLGASVITNTVVVKPNYRDCEDIAKMIVKLGVKNFQFAFVHPMGNAWLNFDSIVPCISIAAPYIHKGLQIGIDAGARPFAEAMPYCMMQCYENQISEKIIPHSEIKGLKHQTTLDFTTQRKLYGKVKFKQCKKCKYDSVCEGPWREYFKKKGDQEFIPIFNKDFISKCLQKKLFFSKHKILVSEIKSKHYDRLKYKLVLGKKSFYLYTYKYNFLQQEEYDILKLLEKEHIPAPNLISTGNLFKEKIFYNLVTDVNAKPLSSIKFKDFSLLANLIFASLCKLHSIKRGAISFTHGDLNLDNIFYKNKKVGFFDFSTAGFKNDKNIDFAFILLSKEFYKLSNDTKSYEIYNQLWNLIIEREKIDKEEITKSIYCFRLNKKFNNFLDNPNFLDHCLKVVNEIK